MADKVSNSKEVLQILDILLKYLVKYNIHSRCISS